LIAILRRPPFSSIPSYSHLNEHDEAISLTSSATNLPGRGEDRGFMCRSRLFRQYLEISLVALYSQSWSAAKRIISTAANHFGAFGAGSPSSVSFPQLSKPECHAPRSRDSHWFCFSLKRFAFNIASVYA
jgi:hypothetical protein